MPGTVTVTINLTCAQSVAQDIHTYWMQRIAGTVGVLADAIGASDTTLTISAGALTPAAGTTIAIDSEPMIVTAASNGVLSVVRTVGTLAAPAMHSAGATVYQLQFPDPWAMIAALSLRPWAQGVVNGLGAASATFGSTATGAITTDE